jgi:N-acetylglucosaminyl-diphospho-decaprenol L-rhamnosyltransferase
VPQPDSGRAGAVVVNYNAGHHLRKAVASLRRDGVDDIVVVDNGSVDDSLAALQSADGGVRVVHAGSNLGFGGAANRGVAATDTRYVAVLNPDVVVKPETIGALVAALDANPRLAIVGPRIDTPNGEWYPSARAFPTLRDALGHAFLHFVAPRNRFSRRYKVLDHDPAVARPADWVSGTFFVVRRDAFDAVGGFDEAYFMYVEDVDLCWRLRQAGWDVRYDPAGRVTHVIGVSSERAPYRMILAHHRSLFRFSVKTHTGRRRALLPFIAVGLALRALLACLQRAVRRRPPAAP